LSRSAGKFMVASDSHAWRLPSVHNENLFVFVKSSI
jgi:hypothetical protein